MFKKTALFLRDGFPNKDDLLEDSEINLAKTPEIDTTEKPW